MARPFWLTKFLVRSGIARFLPVARRLTDGGTAYLRYYSDAVLAAPVEELLDPAMVHHPVGPDVIDLNLPAPRFGSALSTGRPSVDRQGNPPAWGTPELRNAIADLYVRRDGRAVDPDREIVVTHGATGAYAAALDAFVSPGEPVVLFDPCSPLFALGAKSRRAALRWVRTRTEEGICRYEPRDLERALRGAKLLVLADPANPTGACLSAEQLDHIIRTATRFDVLVYADESLGRLRYDGRGRSLAMLPGGDMRVLTAGSVTHGWGLESARIGWLAGPQPLVQACALTANLHAPYVPTVCQHVAARALAEPEADFTPTWSQFRAKRQYVVDRLRNLGLEFDRPAAGYFVWVSVAKLGLRGRAFVERLLREHNVRVGPGDIYGPSGNDSVRISFAGDDGRLREGLSRFAAFVNGLRDPVPMTEEPPLESQMSAEEETQPVFSRV